MFVIPYFIPHQGCPHQCLFCDQHSITGQRYSRRELRDDISATISRWLDYRREPKRAQFAFYGGSFTCLPHSLQKSMLEAVQPWVANGDIEAIRLSTRPDCIDPETPSFLQRYNVGTVELGVQSLDDGVLVASRRGHDSSRSLKAAEYIKRAGMELGIQLMPGLPKESRASFRKTVHKTVEIGPDFVRLYPALVIRSSPLAELFNSGRYAPLSLSMAIVQTAWARRRFVDRGIRVVRMGLQPSPALEESVLAGPYHPAFGELVLSRGWLGRVRRIMAAHPGKKITMTIAERDLSCFNGAGKSNRKRLRQLGLEARLEVVVDKSLERGSLHYVVC